LIFYTRAFHYLTAVPSLPLRLHGKTRHASKGFTLIEMLVVLVLIGLLASLVGPRL
jgi:prepilin-type N-terminal cleavage/methylation domain-containing protein